MQLPPFGGHYSTTSNSSVTTSYLLQHPSCHSLIGCTINQNKTSCLSVSRIFIHHNGSSGSYLHLANIIHPNLLIIGNSMQCIHVTLYITSVIMAMGSFVVCLRIYFALGRAGFSLNQQIIAVSR